MAAPAVAAGASSGAATGASAAGAAASTSKVASFASNASLVGGALDSLGLSITGWIDRANYNRAQQQEQANFDKQFDESVRQFGLQYALNDFATRKGLSLQEAQQMYSQGMQTRQMQTQLEDRQTTRQVNQMGLDDLKRRRSATLSFIKGFTSAHRGRSWQPQTQQSSGMSQQSVLM